MCVGLIQSSILSYRFVIYSRVMNTGSLSLGPISLRCSLESPGESRGECGVFLLSRVQPCATCCSVFKIGCFVWNSGFSHTGARLLFPTVSFTTLGSSSFFPLCLHHHCPTHTPLGAGVHVQGFFELNSF